MRGIGRGAHECLIQPCDKVRFNIMLDKALIRIAIPTAAILLLPFLAMHFTDEVLWDAADFVVAGALIFAAGLTYQRIARKGRTTAYRVAVGVAVAATLLLVWTHLAVGLIE